MRKTDQRLEAREGFRCLAWGRGRMLAKGGKQTEKGGMVVMLLLVFLVLVVGTTGRPEKISPRGRIRRGAVTRVMLRDDRGLIPGIEEGERGLEPDHAGAGSLRQS